MRPGSKLMAMVAVGLLVVGCSGDSDGAASSSTGVSSSVTDVVGESTTSSVVETTEARDATTTTTSTIAPEPTGTPGLEDVDPFCAAWAAYAGTIQAIGVSAAFGDASPDDVARFEVIASTVLVEAAAQMDASMPTSVEPERDVLLDDLVGPFVRRAERALQMLETAGATTDDLAALAAAWTSMLATRDPAQPGVALEPLGPALQSLVDAATAQFAAEVTGFTTDPSLFVESVDTPLTNAYLGATCPDLAGVGVGDSV